MDEESRKLVAKAISKAREVFEKVFSDEGFDVSYFRLSLKVEELADDFESVLHTIEDREDG